MATASGGFAVEGMRELNRLFKNAPKDVRREIRQEYRTVAEPVRSTAETLAGSSIRRIGPRWSRMRTGVTQTEVYVAPRQRGVKGRGSHPRRRPNLGTLLAKRATQPALRQHEHRIEADVDRMLGRLCRDWNSG
jgi:hypothetical protein